jgi:hypothetical protein
MIAAAVMRTGVAVGNCGMPRATLPSNRSSASRAASTSRLTYPWLLRLRETKGGGWRVARHLLEIALDFVGAEPEGLIARVCILGHQDLSIRFFRRLHTHTTINT